MSFSNNKECIVYEGEPISGVSLKKRKYLSVETRVIVWAACLLAVLLTWFVIKTVAFNSSESPDGGGDENGFIGTDTFEQTENTPITDAESESGAIDESNGTESEGEVSAEESKAAETEVRCEIITNDLSFYERGDAYMIDYSGRHPDVEGILEMGFSGGRYSYSQKPVVLILHTHTAEAYIDFDNKDPSASLTKSVVSVGEVIAYELNTRGIPTVHCTVIHSDEKGRGYDEAAETIKDMLRIYPSLRYVIDVHRLEEKDQEGRLVKTESALGTAQLRMTVSDEGMLPRDTLALALGIRRKLNEEGKRLCMPVVYTDSRFNSDMVQYYIKLDVGSMGNTSDEARAAGRYFAETMAALLKK